MVPSLKELNRLCQKPNYKKIGNWMVQHIVRDAALPVTWLLLHTSITANQVTGISLGIALLGILFFASTSSLPFLIGTILLQVWYLLDHVDGQIARYRKTASLTGRFFDFLTHHLIHGAVFFAIGVHVSRVAGTNFPTLWGFVMSLAVMIFNLINDTKYKTFFEALGVGVKFRVIKQGAKQEQDFGKGRETRSFFRWAFSFCHKICEIHVLMNILTLLAVLEFALKLEWDSRFLVFVIYGFVVPFIAVTKILYLILFCKIDSEFESVFERLEG